MTQVNSQYYIGWDIGGAHLKAALMHDRTKLIDIVQIPCPLWKGMAQLDEALDTIIEHFQSTHAIVGGVCHGVTMTGELVDLFDSRKTGVLTIAQHIQSRLIGDVKFYASAESNHQLLPFTDVAQYWQSIASANWHASAALIAARANTGLLIDIGSTTTDLIMFRAAKVCCIGFTDATRMQFNELIYMGVVRTPLMAIAQTIAWGDKQTNVAAEFFATMADVYRLTGDLPAKDDMAGTADGHDKSDLSTARRIARMIGYDVCDATMGDWIALAESFKAEQKKRLLDAIQGHVQLMMTLEPDRHTIQLIGAGVGCFLVEEMVDTLNEEISGVQITYQSSASLLQSLMPDDASAHMQLRAGHCLPAVATAYFARLSSLS